MNPATTVPQLLRNAAELHGPRMALRQPHGKTAQTWTWNEYLQAAEEIAAGLRALGIGKGDHVAVCSETRAEFYLVDQGILMSGAVCGALYPSYPPDELRKTIANADARVLFVEDPKMLARLTGAPVERIILMTGDAPCLMTGDAPCLMTGDAPGVMTGDAPCLMTGNAPGVMTGDAPGVMTGNAPGVTTLNDLRKHGRYAADVRPEDNAILYLTSGATGEPKMVMVTHGSLAANVNMAPKAVPLCETDITVAFLPSAHIAQRLGVELLPIRTGTAVSFAESLAKLPGELKAVRPTFFLAPPRVWERMYTSIRAEVLKKPAMAQKAFYAALGLGLGAAKYRHAGKPVPFRFRWPLKLANRLVFDKIRERLGGRLTLAVSGAAPLGADLMEFYEAIGIPLIEAYGLTEGGVASINPIDAPRPGSIGKALDGVQFRVCGDGELLIKSPCLSNGYYKDPETTAEVLRDGWLHTGDIGTIDGQGYIYITGRKKELIVASNGKKIYPARVEALYKFEPLINQVLLAGDKLPHLVALFTLHPNVAEAIPGAKESGGPLHESAPVVSEVQAIVSRVNRQLAPFEQVKRFRILPREFSIDHGEVTATLKVRRKQVMENFRAELDSLYQLSASGRGGE
jgi:long-chain acyl-CoA synthetase